MRRKDDHIRINRDENVQSGVDGGFDSYSLEHNALPEIDFKEIDTTCDFLGKKVNAPILISSMTGGTQSGDEINIRLAKSAQKFGIAMGVGSQRVAIESDSRFSSEKIRESAPDIPLYANLGAVQLNYGMGITQCQKAVDLIKADALILHLNPLQEALQPEGQTNFAGLLKKIALVSKELGVPVIVKEVGWGISVNLAKRLVEAGVSCIDVAGSGGTSWALVEKFRNTDPYQAATCQNFGDWGISTAVCLEEIRQQLPKIALIASGGIRNGIDAAKSLVLGASLAGFAGRLLRAAAASQETVDLSIQQIINELKIAMFATGSQDLQALSRVRMHKKL